VEASVTPNDARDRRRHRLRRPALTSCNRRRTLEAIKATRGSTTTPTKRPTSCACVSAWASAGRSGLSPGRVLSRRAGRSARAGSPAQKTWTSR
jgi:hypothetical protein